MKLFFSEKNWSSIGKTLTIISTVVITSVGVGELYKTFNKPRLVVFAEKVTVCIPPYIIDHLKESLSKSTLANRIKKDKTEPKTAEEILIGIEELLTDSEHRNRQLETFALRLSTPFHLTIVNQGRKVAQDTKLMMPGHGVAWIGESIEAKKIKDFFAWNGEINLGDLRPRGEINVEIWPDSVAFMFYGFEKAAIVSTEGTGKIYEIIKFPGSWDINLIRRWYSYGLHLRALLFAVAVLLCWYCIKKAKSWRKKA